jgi:thiamine-phosphate pyrophosphorylase
VDWIQIREKDLPARELFDLTTECVALAAGRTRILVNDRLDVALAAGAAGVHLGRESAPAREVKQWCRAGHAPPGFLVGVSCHSLDEALHAEADGVDYIFFGPVFATPSKEAFGPPQGIARLAEVCRSVRIPALAIGGIAPENAAECFRAGAAGIAAIRLFQQTTDLPAVVERLRKF